MNAKEIEKDEREFEEQLNETYGTVEVCGMTMDQGTVLKEMDPVAFRCAMSDEPLCWECGACNEPYDDEDEANDCCQVECAECGQKFDEEKEAKECREEVTEVKP